LPVPINSDIFWPLVLLAALLWPLDVAVRRITLSPRQLVANAVLLVTERRARDLEVAVADDLVRLRTRIASTRRRRAAPAPPPVMAPPPEVEAAAAAGGEADAERQRQEEALSARLLEARRKRRRQGD
jgi:hypothetical protein